MKPIALIASFFATLVMTGCDAPETTEANGGVPAKSTNITRLEPVSVPQIELSAVAQKGEKVFIRCAACHSVAEGEPHLVGPSIHGLIDAPSAAKEGYPYSAAMGLALVKWDRETLDRWIENPQAVVPGTKMAFAGIADEQQRAALIQYIAEVTK